MNMFPDYEAFLSTFREQNYSIEPLVAVDLATKRVLYLRHDIDFDVELTLEMARIEARRGTRATYFVMLTSDSFNIFPARNAACVAEIKRCINKIKPFRHIATRFDRKASKLDFRKAGSRAAVAGVLRVRNPIGHEFVHDVFCPEPAVLLTNGRMLPKSSPRNCYGGHNLPEGV